MLSAVAYRCSVIDQAPSVDEAREQLEAKLGRFKEVSPSRIHMSTHVYTHVGAHVLAHAFIQVVAMLAHAHTHVSTHVYTHVYTQVIALLDVPKEERLLSLTADVSAQLVELNTVCA